MWCARGPIDEDLPSVYPSRFAQQGQLVTNGNPNYLGKLQKI